MPNPSNELTSTDVLREQLARLIRYTYPGVLVLGVLSFNFQKQFKEYIDSVGLGVLTLASAAIGTAVFAFYRLFIGEFIIFQIVHLIHNLLAKMNLVPEGTTRWIGRVFKVRFGNRRNAYRFLRNHFNTTTDRRWLDLVHTELHIIYLSGTVVLASAFFGMYLNFISTPISKTFSLNTNPTNTLALTNTTPPSNINPTSTPALPITTTSLNNNLYQLIIIGLALLIGGIFADIKEHASEALHFKDSTLGGVENIRTKLLEAGFITIKDSNASTATAGTTKSET